MKVTVAGFSTKETRSKFYQRTTTKKDFLKLCEKAFNDKDVFVVRIRFYRDL